MIPNSADPTVRVLITGANGFLGSAIVRQAVASGMSVHATDRNDAASLSGVHYSRADILNPTSLAAALDGVESVIHVAGLAHIFDKTQATSAPFKTVNEIGTANVAHAAAQAGVRHLILISSVSVYGGIAIGVDETAPCHPEGPYAESKWQAEQRAIEIARSAGMRLTILRLVTLYGEGDPGNVARLMRSIDRGRFAWIGDGSNRKSLLHREDAARACLTVLRAPGEGVNIYNVSAPPCTMRQVVDGLAAALGRKVFPLHIPASLTLFTTRFSSNLVCGRGRLGALYVTMQKWLADDVYDARKFERAFSFHAQVSLTEGLRREVAWYRETTRRY